MVISIIGYPWSGKSTIARRLSQILDVPHMTTGDLVRQYGISQEDVKEFAQSDLSIRLNEYVMDSVHAAVQSHKHLILDGYPRSAEQRDALYRDVGENVCVLWVYSNPVMLMERVNKNQRGDRVDDSIEVVSARINLAVRLKDIVQEYTSKGWGFHQFTLDDCRVSEAIGIVSRCMLARMP